MPRAVDADIRRAGPASPTDDQVHDGVAGDAHESVDPSRKLFDVNASGDAWAADVAARLRVRRAGHRGATGRRRAGDAGRGGRIRQAAHPVRPGDRLVPGDQAQARRRAHRAGVGPAAGLRRGAVAGRRFRRHRTRCQRREGRRGRSRRCWPRGRRCRPTARSASPRSTTCRCCCCGCRRCARPGATRPRTGDGYWRRCDAVHLTNGETADAETVAGDLVAKHAGPEAVRAAMESERGYDESLWTAAVRAGRCRRAGGARGTRRRRRRTRRRRRRPRGTRPGPGAHPAARHHAGRTRAAGRRRARRRHAWSSWPRAASIGARGVRPRLRGQR